MNIIDISPLKTINCLVVIPYCHHIWRIASGCVGEVKKDSQLREVGILKFINQYLLVLRIQSRLQIGGWFAWVDLFSWVMSSLLSGTLLQNDFGFGEHSPGALCVFLVADALFIPETQPNASDGQPVSFV